MLNPLIVGIGGSLQEGSSSEVVLSIALAEARRRGARTVQLSGGQLDFPLYRPGVVLGSQAKGMLAAVAEADGLILSSPCYHGGISGLIKNAIDYLEELRSAERSYLDGRAVGCIGCGLGWQGPNSVLSSLRATVHSLRGWPTPLGLAVNTETVKFRDGACSDDGVSQRLGIMVGQVVGFAFGYEGRPAA